MQRIPLPIEAERRREAAEDRGADRVDLDDLTDTGSLFERSPGRVVPDWLQHPMPTERSMGAARANALQECDDAALGLGQAERRGSTVRSLRRLRGSIAAVPARGAARARAASAVGAAARRARDVLAAAAAGQRVRLRHDA